MHWIRALYIEVRRYQPNDLCRIHSGPSILRLGRRGVGYKKSIMPSEQGKCLLVKWTLDGS
jgi:hypothetical protein